MISRQLYFTTPLLRNNISRYHDNASISQQRLNFTTSRFHNNSSISSHFVCNFLPLCFSLLSQYINCSVYSVICSFVLYYLFPVWYKVTSISQQHLYFTATTALFHYISSSRQHISISQHFYNHSIYFTTSLFHNTSIPWQHIYFTTSL